MAKREVVGVMICPECGMTGAEIKTQKNGLLYRYCPECNAQYFPRTAEASARLGKACGAIPPTVAPVPVPAEHEVRVIDPIAERDSFPPPEAPKPKPKPTLADALMLLGGSK